MKPGDILSANIWRSDRLVLGALLVGIIVFLPAPAAPQADSEIPPDATPQIQQIDPAQGAPGAHVTVVIHGSNFSGGAYVSSVSAAVRVESSRRVSATQMEAQLSINASAQPSTVSLLVSNPASRAAEAAFNIVAGAAPPAPEKPPESVEPLKPAAPSTPSAPSGPTPPAAPATPQNPATPTPPATPAAPPAPPAPSAPAPPATPSSPAAPAAPPGAEVTTIEPPRVGPGFDMDLKITGKNFDPRAKVSFANPGIRVVGITSSSTTTLTVHIKVAHDAAAGVGSLFVINPDDREVEAPFEVTAKGTPAPSPSPASPTAPGSTETQRYDAFHLGNPAEIFQAHGKVKGTLVVSAGTIQYQEDGKTLINIAASDIKEIKTSSIATATFHITLTSGKTYHFAPGSLRPSDARNLVDSLRKALPQ